MDPLVEEVDLIEANPRYAYISFPDGRQSTVATKHLAPTGERTKKCLVTNIFSIIKSGLFFVLHFVLEEKYKKKKDCLGKRY